MERLRRPPPDDFRRFPGAARNQKRQKPEGGEPMLIPIKDIKMNPGRRTAEPEDVENLAESIAELGLLNPITIDQNNTLIAGRHRLEAAKFLFEFLHFPSGVSPPPVTIMWIWGWNCRFCPQVCRTAVIPGLAPRNFLSAHNSRTVSDAALNSRSYIVRGSWRKDGFS